LLQHLASENFIDARLVTFALRLEPRDEIGIQQLRPSRRDRTRKSTSATFYGKT
jgi:hypothetical protein